MRTLLILGLVLLSGCNCSSPECVSGDPTCADAGAGGGNATGGGAATGGGSATGGGTATGGGVATGGGSATGGGIATGGGTATGGGAAFAHHGYLKASNTAAGAGFGWTLAASADGSTLAIAAIREASKATGIDGDQTDTSAQSGAVYVFGRSGSSWAQQGYLKPSNTGPSFDFGVSLALSADGNTLAVGASGERSLATGINGNQSDTSGASCGAVYVFSRTGSTWVQQAYLKASNTNSGDYFGYSVALGADGNTLAVGAFNEDSKATGIGGNQADNSAIDSGAVYVFSRTGSAWVHQAYLKPSVTRASQAFGHSVALSADGSTLAVGSSGQASKTTGVGGDQSDFSAPASGAAYVFLRSGATWAQQAFIKASNTGAGDKFGSIVALSADGDGLAIGAPLEASQATGVGGVQTNDAAPGSGAAYVFGRAGGVWTQQAYVKASNSEAQDSFGYGLTLSGDGATLVVGAMTESSNATGVDGNQADNAADRAGAAYAFTRTGTSWAPTAYLKASNTDAVDLFGRSLALSFDGTLLLVGADGEASRARGVDGDQTDNSMFASGAAYVLQR